MPGSSRWSLSLRFPHQNPVSTPPLHHTCYSPHPSHSFWVFTWSSRYFCTILIKGRLAWKILMTGSQYHISRISVQWEPRLYTRIYRRRDRHDEETFSATTQMNLKWPHGSPIIISLPSSSGRNPRLQQRKEVRRKDLQTDKEALLWTSQITFSRVVQGYIRGTFRLNFSPNLNLTLWTLHRKMPFACNNAWRLRNSHNFMIKYIQSTSCE